MIQAITPETVLSFWFDEAGPKRWFKPDPKFDAVVRRRFGPMCHAMRAVKSVADHAWLATPDSALALVLVLDQFPRQVWRGSGAAYSLDPLAREATDIMLAAGFDWLLPEQRRAFVYLPLQHSEDIEDQALAVALSEERLTGDPSSQRHARLHRDVVAKFGRFPHRNAALNRTSTPAEAAFLEGGGYAPGLRRPAKSSPGQD